MSKVGTKRTFEDEERALFIERVRMMSLYMGVPLVLSFSIIDWFYCRQFFFQFLQARLLSVPTCIAVLALNSNRAVRERFYYIPAVLAAAYLGIYTAFMISKTGYEESLYYAGLNLIAIGMLSFLPWSSKTLLLPVLANYGPYVITVVFLKDGAISFPLLIPNIAFCGSTVFLGALTNHVSKLVRKREFESRQLLQEELSTKNQVIATKTQEGIYLEKLTNQFSPQVIEAVKNGRLSVDGLARREVTCLFIDVENSTNRSVRLDRDAYTNVLSEFFGLVTDTLIRHNVTVGTYLGDGMLAFANAPEQQPEHRKIMLSAALEILKVHKLRQRYYHEKWRTDFNIRIGINTGYVFVGFFPSFKRGTYTALGEPVNLTARLCNRAPYNAILVTKTFLKEAASNLKDVKVSNQGFLNSLKGFEEDSFELFSIVPLPQDEAQLGNRCPLCNNSLLIENALGDCNLVKCSKCGYSDLVSIKDGAQEAA